mmetsp:Transcript_94243/g.266726  ORF Transcript_94243/g.266726 Transcript_94243/m.266726 type:complete len:363 (+) Transcript_94243:381-1469(+)
MPPFPGRVQMQRPLPRSQSFSPPPPVPVRACQLSQFTARQRTSSQRPFMVLTQAPRWQSQTRSIPSIEPETACADRASIATAETQTRWPCSALLTTRSRSHSRTAPSVEPLRARCAPQFTSRHCTEPWWPPRSAWAQSACSRSHAAMVPSEWPLNAWHVSQFTTTQLKLHRYSCMVSTHSPRSRSHSRSELSAAPLSARRAPQSTDMQPTRRVCPCRTSMQALRLTSHRHSVPSDDPLRARCCRTRSMCTCGAAPPRRAACAGESRRTSSGATGALPPARTTLTSFSGTCARAATRAHRSAPVVPAPTGTHPRSWPLSVATFTLSEDLFATSASHRRCTPWRLRARSSSIRARPRLRRRQQR